MLPHVFHEINSYFSCHPNNSVTINKWKQTDSSLDKKINEANDNKKMSIEIQLQVNKW